MVDIYKGISEELPPRAEISSQDEWKVEKQKLHSGVVECFRGWPERSPLNAHVLEISNLSLDEGLPEVKAEKIYFHSEVDILIPAVLFHPQNETSDGFDVQIILNHDGKESLEPQNVISEIQAGRGVLGIDVRGVGETKSDMDLLFSSVIAGRPIQGMQAWDVRCAVDYLCGRDDVRSISLRAIGSPLSGIVALIAAATDGRISEVQIDKLLLSYRMQEDFGGNGNLVIPGILKYVDVADIAAMIAPRPMEIKEFISADDKQPLSCEITAAFERCAYIYSLLSAKENLKFPS